MSDFCNFYDRLYIDPNQKVESSFFTGNYTDPTHHYIHLNAYHKWYRAQAVTSAVLIFIIVAFLALGSLSFKSFILFLVLLLVWGGSCAYMYMNMETKMATLSKSCVLKQDLLKKSGCTNPELLNSVIDDPQEYKKALTDLYTRTEQEEPGTEAHLKCLPKVL